MVSPGEPTQSASPGRDAEILRERDRIAAGLHDEVIGRVFTIGLNLQTTAALATDRLLRGRIEQAIDDLDALVHVIRATVFDLQTRLKDPGLLEGILHLCEQLSPVPDVTLRGPVNGALQPADTAGLLDVLDDALLVIGHHWTPVAIDISAADGAHVTMLQLRPLPDATSAAGEPDDEFPRLRDRAAQAGIRIEIEPGPELVQISWHAA
jgi:hypothetical protein